MIVDGRAIARDVLDDVRALRTTIPDTVTLAIVVATDDPVIESFVRIKTKLAAELDVTIVRIDLAEATTEAVMNALQSLKHDSSIHGIIVQLPMPDAVDVNAVLSEVPLEKDIDGINPFTHENERRVHAPVALAVQEILQRANVNVRDKHVVIVGAGRLVGLPTAALLRDAGAIIHMVTETEGSIHDLKQADIIVSGAGQPHFITQNVIKPGVVLIDAGTSESGGVIVGDVDPACAELASVFTPVPGGVGPIAVAMIFKNLLALKIAAV